MSPNGQNCSSSKGGAVRADDEVRITNGKDELIGQAKLGAPAIADGSYTRISSTYRDCTFTFTIEDVPAGEKFYQVKVGKSDEGTLSEDDLRKGLNLAF